MLCWSFSGARRGTRLWAWRGAGAGEVGAGGGSRRREGHRDGHEHRDMLKLLPLVWTVRTASSATEGLVCSGE